MFVSAHWSEYRNTVANWSLVFNSVIIIKKIKIFFFCLGFYCVVIANTIPKVKIPGLN